MSSPITQIEDDIYQVALPLPFALRIINAYLLRGDNGWTVVDAGLNTSLARQTWETAFGELNIAPDEIEQIVLTHTHPDHFGLAGWLQARSAREDGWLPPVKMSPVEYDAVKNIWFRLEQWGEETGAFWELCAIPDEVVTAVIESTLQTGQRTFPQPTKIELIEPNSSVRLGNRTFQTYEMQGHSDGQLVFYDAADRLLLCGDHVLQKITPNVSRWPYGLKDPLGAYLNSFATLRTLNVRKALPGHRAVLTDLNGRMDELEAHHAERLDLILTAVSAAQTVYQTSNILFNHSKLTSHETRFAVTESLAHLEYWRFRGKLARTGDTVWLYHPV